MGIKSWQKEYVGVSIQMSADDSELAAVEHSIQKWKGLRLKNLEKHNLTAVSADSAIRNKYFESFAINSDNCALCVRHTCRCSKCSLGKMLKGNCWRESDSPFETWINTGDPEPMIKALKKTEKRLMKKAGYV